jgi:hypothetical protein
MLIYNLDYKPYVHFKSPLLYDWCMFIEIHPLIDILIQIGYVNPQIFLSNWLFYNVFVAFE